MTQLLPYCSKCGSLLSANVHTCDFCQNTALRYLHIPDAGQLLFLDTNIFELVVADFTPAQVISDLTIRLPEDAFIGPFSSIEAAEAYQKYPGCYKTVAEYNEAVRFEENNFPY